MKYKIFCNEKIICLLMLSSLIILGKIDNLFGTEEILTICNVENNPALEGEWKYIKDDGMEYKETYYDDSNWDSIEYSDLLDPDIADENITYEYGYMWIRKEFYLCEELADQPIAIELGKNLMAIELYINGGLVGTSGRFPPDYFLTPFHYKHYMIDSNFLNVGEEKNVIAIRLFSDAGYFRLHKATFIDYETMQNNEFWYDFLNEDINIITVAMALIFGFSQFIFYLGRRKDLISLFFALCCFSGAIYTMNLFLTDFFLGYIWFRRITHDIIVLQYVFFFLVVIKLFDYWNKRSIIISQITVFFTIYMVFIFLPQNSVEDNKYFNMLMAFLFSYTIPVSYIIIKNVIRKNKIAYYILSGWIIVNIFSAIDGIYQSLNIFPIAWLQGLGYVIFILFVLLAINQNYLNLYNNLSELSKSQKNYIDKLKEIDKLKDEFLSNTSHELRTPLNGIIGIAESLVDGATGTLPPPTNQNLKMIISSGKRLSNLVNDILDFSKLKNKELNLKLTAVDIKSLTDVVLLLSKPLIAGKELKLINNVPNDIPAVKGDENRLQQIFYNLIGNAIKFTQSGEVTISAKKLNQNVEICVSDTGVGIPEDKQTDIFKSFEQVDASTEREYGGTGIGLSITKQLIELHQGEIWVESEVGKGSKFYFALPASDETITITDTEKESLSNVELEDVDEIIIEQTALSNDGDFNILIVDDEPVNIQVLSNHLSLLNYRIQQAYNGEQALECFQREVLPDLVILDIMMPRMSGYEVCKRIREKYPPNQLPVIMLTAKNQVNDLLEGLESGANDYLTKPFSKTELIGRLKTHINLSKMNISMTRFVPTEFLKYLKRESLVDIKLGDQVQQEMTVLFSDIRSFTTLSESMTPSENFNFLNRLFGDVSPIIRKNNGFIDKYIGDAIMALFPLKSDDAIKASIDMQRALRNYNYHRRKRGYDPVRIGIGLNTGMLMLGTIGEEKRMETTVISDAVNLASRIEGLTKKYGITTMVTESVISKLENTSVFNYRFIDLVKVKGKANTVAIYEVFDGDPESLIEVKRETKTIFEESVILYHSRQFKDALESFKDVLDTNPLDYPAQAYLKRAAYYIEHEPPPDWASEEVMDSK